MHKFAHVSDIHLGANVDPALSKLELKAFSRFIEACMKEEVNFILVCGDLFHVPIPDMRVVDEAVKKLKGMVDAGIPVYTIYGSHDYTPNGKSVIDVLESAGIITSISRSGAAGDKLLLEYFVDKETGAKIAGISGRKGSLDRESYEILDRGALEREDAFRIFAFHAALREFKPEYLPESDSIPISYLPKGLEYYAGGHIHERSERNLPGYERVVFPGVLFGSQTRDFENSGRGEKHGFYLVSFEKRVIDARFVPVEVCDFLHFEYDASGRNALEAGRDLVEHLDSLNVKDKVVTLKIWGELSGGKTSDINVARIRKHLEEREAITVRINRHSLTSTEFTATRSQSEDSTTIENRLFEENLDKISIPQESLKGRNGLGIANELLKCLRQPAKSHESKHAYVSRMLQQGIEILDLKGLLGE